MPDAFRAEFTGERVIPGEVEDNLFNEHLARYRFAARLSSSGRILDAGCGAGYGAAELAKSGAEVLAIDVSEEAIAHAQSNYADISGIRFEKASCTAIPAGDGEFRMITAFEVIEHLENWRDFLREASRVLDAAGIFFVSTPNRLYYAESRQKEGPNPFHVHEFTEAEFRSELIAVFPHVKLLLQNHVEGIGFSGQETEGIAFEVRRRDADPDNANFFLAVCGKQPLPEIPDFVFIPETGNVLQTRGRHIALLEGEILKKNEWIAQEQVERRRMLDKVRDLEAELEQHNQWAQRANEEAARRAELVAALQEELRKSNDWAKARDAEATERGERILQLQEELEKSIEWARQQDAEADQRGRRIIELQDELQRSNERAKEEAEGYERAIDEWRRAKDAADQWAIETERRLSAERDSAREAFAARGIELEIAQQRLAESRAEAEQLRGALAQAKAQLEMVAQSRWVRLGRAVRIGPEIHRN